MTPPKRGKHSRDRAKKRGEGDIYGVIDELLAPAFACWIAAQCEQVGIDEIDSTESKKVEAIIRPSELVGVLASRNKNHPER
jgi:hypothetical protein